MAYSNPAFHTARFMERPEGFTAYRGKGCPVSPNTYVELLFDPKEGLAIGPVMKAGSPRLVWWKGKKPSKGSGAIVGWRLAAPPERPVTQPPAD